MTTFGLIVLGIGLAASVGANVALFLRVKQDQSLQTEIREQLAEIQDKVGELAAERTIT